MNHDPYLIRNDVTGRTWTAHASEARLYAVGGILDAHHTVFTRYGSGIGLIVQEVC